MCEERDCSEQRAENGRRRKNGQHNKTDGRCKQDMPLRPEAAGGGEIRNNAAPGRESRDSGEPPPSGNVLLLVRVDNALDSTNGCWNNADSNIFAVLQDPAVASSPVEKKVAFLQSKNLTKEEVDLALSRAGEDPSAVAAVTAPSSSTGYQSPSPQSVYRPPPPPQGYGYPPYGQWQPPPEPPKRDWRDWFIMATVMGGVGYGMYTVAKRYITPLIAPPTPPQLEQDKENIDEQFSRAFTLIEQLSTDTAALKTAEETRTERLDTALREVENLVADLKTSSRRRDDETRRISDEVKSLKDAIPKAMEGAREGNENRLKELGTEVKSLKVLLGNRLGGAGSSSPVAGKPVGTSLPTASRPLEESTPTTPAAAAAPATANGASAIPVAQEPQPSTGAAPAASTPSTPSAGGNPLSQFNRSASIPAWQMAAANRSKTASPASPATPATNAGDSSSSTTDIPAITQGRRPHPDLVLDRARAHAPPINQTTNIAPIDIEDTTTTTVTTEIAITIATAIAILIGIATTEVIDTVATMATSIAIARDAPSGRLRHRMRLRLRLLRP
ncbi:putative peroxisomal membrane anchor protein (Pex14) [Aspergillus affinis]|uniref:putative peroxisomal membrane anchor protein (Pex14) n=1 Tax=Aspergillus affinis TaxID=1070780 RepID=UPI0022FDC4F1|nr:uncharacterized protein KD926_001043 [Aspergillus affinis]KAI9044442.1 hypothetical protein KD926_001043 [Aspergillus affinis]